VLLYALTITLQVRLRLKAGWAAEGFKFALSLKLSTLEHAMLPQLTLRVDRLVVGLVADVELVPRTTMPFLEAVSLCIHIIFTDRAGAILARAFLVETMVTSIPAKFISCLSCSLFLFLRSMHDYY
jgi:hypothetical protein